MSACDHEKVYSGERFLTLVPRWFWICARCKATGEDPMSKAPPVDFNRYVEILSSVDPQGAAGMRKLWREHRR